MIDVDKLLDKEKWTRKRNAILCAVPGSGFHEHDVSAPQKRGEPRLDSHLVVFAGPFEHIFVGESAAAALKTLADYAAAYPPKEQDDPHLRTLAKTAVEYAAHPAGEPLVVRGQQWNAVREVLSICGIGITSTDAEPFPEDDPILKTFRV